MIATQVETVKNRLKQELYVNIKQNWLEDCVNYFVHSDPQIGIDNLYKNTKTQLLLANYPHFCDPVIPNSFRTVDTTWTYRGNLFLQMQFILDICKLSQHSNSI